MQLKTDEQKHSPIMDETWLNLRKTRQLIRDLNKSTNNMWGKEKGICSTKEV